MLFTNAYFKYKNLARLKLKELKRIYKEYHIILISLGEKFDKIQHQFIIKTFKIE